MLAISLTRRHSPSVRRTRLRTFSRRPSKRHESFSIAELMILQKAQPSDADRMSPWQLISADANPRMDESTGHSTPTGSIISYELLPTLIRARSLWPAGPKCSSGRHVRLRTSKEDRERSYQ